MANPDVKTETPNRIISARITAMPKDLLDPMPKVMVKFSHDPDTEVFLFEYYPDEISFTSQEFMGLTIDQAHRLKFKKDKNYLKS